MNKTLLYIFGAGASSQALPLANQLADRLLSFAADLKTINPSNIQRDTDTSFDKLLWGGTREAFVKALQWLGSESKRHVSVDTYAKKLFFKHDKQNLKKLKTILSAYLVVEQSLKPADKRYDAFLATILEFDAQKNVSLPQHLRIINWNYDTQLEKAFYGFCDNGHHVIQSITFNKHIYRVNGYCGTTQPGHIGPAFRSVWKEKNIESAWEEGLLLYKEYMSDKDTIEPDICFAWEVSTQDKLAKADDDLKLQEVHTIVVIGYSFPYFNRQIDEFIWISLSESQVNRIYLQYPDGNHASIENRLRSLLHQNKKNIEIIPITSTTDSFYLPEEFWQLK